MERQSKKKLHSRVIKTKGGCWEFTGAIAKSGYGACGLNGKVMNAHRASYILTYGEIQNNLLVCHKCDNRKCINPKHLFLGTHLDNYDDMVKKGRRKSKFGYPLPLGHVNKRVYLKKGIKTACVHGHKYTPENTIYNKKGHRSCYACHLIRRKNYYNKNKQRN